MRGDRRRRRERRRNICGGLVRFGVEDDIVSGVDKRGMGRRV